METEEHKRRWLRQTFGQGGDYLQLADCAPPTTVGTAIIMSSMGALGFVLLGAQTRSTPLLENPLPDGDAGKPGCQRDAGRKARPKWPVPPWFQRSLCLLPTTTAATSTRCARLAGLGTGRGRGAGVSGDWKSGKRRRSPGRPGSNAREGEKAW